MEQPFFFFFAYGLFFFSSVILLQIDFFFCSSICLLFFLRIWGPGIVPDHGQVRGAPVMRGIKKNWIFRDQTRGVLIMRVSTIFALHIPHPQLSVKFKPTSLCPHFASVNLLKQLSA